MLKVVDGLTHAAFAVDLYVAEQLLPVRPRQNQDHMPRNPMVATMLPTTCAVFVDVSSQAVDGGKEFQVLHWRVAQPTTNQRNR